ncbi:MAG TPA: SDR family oxidoreductase [Drouetiella sp.]
MKIAVITGGSRGVGKSTALEIAKRGIGVILTYHSKAAEAQIVVDAIKKDGGKAVALQLDISKVASFDSFIKQVSGALETEWQSKTFDYLVNNAGGAQRTPMPQTTEEEFDRLVNEHFKGPFFLTQKLMPLMADGGQVINISSGLTHMTYPGGVATYAACKGALEVITRYVACEYAPRKIRANTVAPGALDTEFGGGRTDEMRQMIASRTFAGRIGLAEDIGKLVAGVLSENFGWVNGQRIEATGGH